MQDDKIIYLDHAAATPVARPVLEAMEPFQTRLFYNPSSPYLPAVKVRQAFEDARHRLAKVIGAKPDEVLITAGATESINIALTVARNAHVVSSEIEHHAVLHPVQTMNHTLVKPTEQGIITPQSIKAVIGEDTRLVSVALANNELGTVQSLREVAEIIRFVRQERLAQNNPTPIWLHTDASQCAGLIDINVARLGVDMMTLNAGKCYGPKQVGLLWRRAGVELEPLIRGGGQEGGLRSGTENVAGAVGFALALERAEKKRKAESLRLSGLRDYMQRQLEAAFDNMVVSGHQKKRLPNFLHIAFDGVDAERLIFSLEARGILLATGSACAANSGSRSHVLTAIGLDGQTADGSLRISLGALNDEPSVKQATQVLIEEISKELSRVGK